MGSGIGKIMKRSDIVSIDLEIQQKMRPLEDKVWSTIINKDTYRLAHEKNFYATCYPLIRVVNSVKELMRMRLQERHYYEFSRSKPT
jgi:hypothetical protein